MCCYLCGYNLQFSGSVRLYLKYDHLIYMQYRTQLKPRLLLYPVFLTNTKKASGQCVHQYLAITSSKCLTLLIRCCAHGTPLCVSEIIVMLAVTAVCQAVSIARSYHFISSAHV
jgi:hypothetical protein